MSATAFSPSGPFGPTVPDRDALGIDAAESESRTITAGFGFWAYLLSDCILFASAFACFAVLSTATAGGPTGRDVINLPDVLLETACLLGSTFTCGMAMLAADRADRGAVQRWLGVTFLLGAAFVGMEVSEFARMVADGAAPTRSAYLSAFFTLVGLHGAHVTAGLIWLAVMLAQVSTLGFLPMVRRRLLCFSLFWHVLDVIWVGVFTIVYLGGVLR